MTQPIPKRMALFFHTLCTNLTSAQIDEAVKLASAVDEIEQPHLSSREEAALRKMLLDDDVASYYGREFNDRFQGREAYYQKIASEISAKSATVQAAIDAFTSNQPWAGNGLLGYFKTMQQEVTSALDKVTRAIENANRNARLAMENKK